MFAVLADHREKSKKTKRQTDIGPFQRTKKVVQHEGNDDTNCRWCSWNDTKRLGEGTGGNGNQWNNRDHPEYSIVEISQNTQKSHGDLLLLRLQ